MVRMMAILGFGVAVFALAAGGSWFVQNQVLKKAPAPAANATAEGTEEVPATAAPAAPAAAGGQTPPAENASDSALSTGPVKERLPVAVRPREMSVEELLRYGMGVKEREQKVKEQEERLEKRRVQQQLARADIEGERREIDGLRVQVGDQLKHAEKLIENLKQIRSQLIEEQANATAHMQQIKHERIEIDTEHLDNTKRLSQWIQSMDPEKAAEVLKSMASDGDDQVEIAVQILRNLEEREAAKILSSIDDTKLVQELIQKFRNLKPPPAKTATRR